MNMAASLALNKLQADDNQAPESQNEERNQINSVQTTNRATENNGAAAVMSIERKPRFNST